MNEIWIAEIWNTDQEEWEIVSGVFHTTEDDAKEATMEEMEVEAGWVPIGKWEPDVESGGIRIEFSFADSTNCFAVARVRKLKCAW